MSAPTCPRCGAPLPGLSDVAVELADDGERAMQASVALESRKLVVPDVCYFALRDLARRLPRHAAAVACHAGVCRPASVVADE